ncbi:penicillin-insensitive murein endopeptidase [Enhygromyxa salina]|uniref:Penicillin-insensitive murein endopeptidase n=2 Tax=Enhygromyxa salina TaxID=215803 RepID=A0A2S9YGD0_9BACT|nr:penicillin-insensitive murein endopeptidase [Enhygromyxa salina]
MLDAAEAALVELEIKIDPRRRARGPLPDASGLRAAHEDGRALVLEGRFEQVRQWTALAKFGSREPGPRCGSSPLSRYDLVVTRDARSRKDLAYLHVVVPAAGLPPEGERGRHEAWIGDERWINLTDALDPTREYLPFKSNGSESLHRQWARETVVESLVDIATQYRQRTGVPLGIGDLSHVTGGKIKDHWTHQEGVDADVYLLDPDHADDDGRPRVWWNHVKRGVACWTSKPKGKGEREQALDPEDELSHTPTSQRLEVLAQIVFLIDEVAYFVHNDTTILEPFDDQAGARRPGRRFLHAKNRGYWPAHTDHVHLRWVEGELPVDVTPRP